VGIDPIRPPTPPVKPSVAAPVPPAPPQPPEERRTWFKDARRPLGAWDRGKPPLPVTGNRVTVYLEVMDYYMALGQAIRATRQSLADFVYIAGWGLDLATFVDRPGTSPRQTIGELLQQAVQRKVEVRAILPSQPAEGQAASLAKLASFGAGAILDPYLKLLGTHHQKFVVIRNAEGICAFCGCDDIDNIRLGRDSVPAGQQPSGAQLSAAWHDPQVKIQGPAAADLWNSFVQRFKEVAAGFRAAEVGRLLMPLGALRPGITAYPPLSLHEPDQAASQTDQSGLDIQVVRTYPNKAKKLLGDELVAQPGYMFAPNGEMGIYSLLVDALDKTTRTIYLEDQYLVNTLPMAGNPPITDAIRRAIERPSFQKMIILVAGTGTVQVELLQAGTRRADFIRQLGPTAASKVSTYVYRADANSPYWLHSKLWIFDDQFAVIGSANCNRRGYSHDSELNVGIADPEKRTGGKHFAHRLRMDLWLKHLNGQPAGAGNTKAGRLGDRDVLDFVAASPLWDKAPLLIKTDFTASPEPDLPLTKRIVDARFPRAARLYGVLSSRELDWSFIDPNGA
jgi:phosphatidylserine/phosphatidylglycerophosphate/cardiolipin synthase-like enzyme